MKEEFAIREAHRRFGNPLAPNDPIPASSSTSLWNERAIDPATVPDDKLTFYNRVHGTVVAQTLLNTLTPGALSNLQLSKHLYTFQDADGNLKQDGPTMLLMLLRKVDPSTAVSIENHRTAIEGAKMQAFKNDVAELISFLEHHHKAIIENGGSYDEETLRRHALNALSSGPNSKFNDFIETITRDIASGIGPHAKITTRELFMSSETYYNNLVSQEQWIKVDPKDARIMALTSELDKLKKGTAPKPSGGGNDGSTKYFGVDKWRTENKGATITRDGVTYHWCPKHVHPGGAYSGLYYRDHDEAGHDEWKKTRRWNKKPGESTAATTDASKGAPSAKKLTIAPELKTALATTFCVPEEDVEKVLAQANNQGN